MYSDPPRGRTTAWWAAAQGSEKCIRILGQAQLDLLIADEDDNTPVHIACKYGHHKVLQSLIDSLGSRTINLRVWLSKRNKLYLSPILLVLEQGFNLCLEILIKSGADLNSRVGMSPLSYAASRVALGHKYRRCFILLATSLPITNLNAHSSDGRTAMYYLLRSREFDLMALLVSLGAHAFFISPEPKRSIELLSEAAKPVTKYFSAPFNIHPAPVSQSCESKPHHQFVDVFPRCSHYSKSQQFGNNSHLMCTVNPVCAKPPEGVSVAFLACLYGHQRCLLDRSLAEVNQRTHRTIFNSKTNHRIDLHRSNCLAVLGEYKRTDIKQSCVGRSDMSQIDLLSSVTKPMPPSCCGGLLGGGLTPAHIACFHGQPECLKILAEKKADLNAQDMYGQTPAHYACMRGDSLCLAVLIHYKAKLEVKDTGLDGPDVHGEASQVELKEDQERQKAENEVAPRILSAAVRKKLSNMEKSKNLKDWTPAHVVHNVDIVYIYFPCHFLIVNDS